MRISVCIPTYKRSAILIEALQSCLNQSLLPYEIIIGDNSPDNRAEALINKATEKSDIHIKYIHHVPSLSQAQNVDALFAHVEGELVVLLHDDDTLLPNCLADLHECFVQNAAVDVAFGKQYMMSHDGKIDYDYSLEINEEFYRNSSYEGSVLSPVEVAILQQFPNDCYMLKSSVAKEIQYKSESMHACDFEFGLKIGRSNYQFYFLNTYTACYRLSADALSKNYNNNGSLIIYQLIDKLDVPASTAQYKRKLLIAKAPVALAQAANLKNAQEVRTIFFSKWHRPSIFSFSGLKGVYHLLRVHL